MKTKILRLGSIISVLLITMLMTFFAAVPALAETTSVRIVKYGVDGKIAAEKTVDWQWMKSNLPVMGDGKTHYYHQGPVFDGDQWDPTKTVNLKDKGAVMGTDVKDLCELVGGMSDGDEVSIRAVDGYHLEMAYQNVYQPLDVQGPIVLCWYNGEDPVDGEHFGVGNPGPSSYATALQVVFQSRVKNASGQYVFANADMRACFPEAKYQHFYEGLASTSGFSEKWVNAIYIYPSGETPVIPTTSPVAIQTQVDAGFPWFPVVLGACGLIFIGVALIFFRKKGK